MEVLLMVSVPIDDGEAKEATLLQFRAKLFAYETKETGWKERGVGILKLNVPNSFVEFDAEGAPKAHTYDPSGEAESDAETSVAARLIMRQENTHRVILNSPIIKAQTFEQKSTSTATHQVVFTSFEGKNPQNLLLRVNTIECLEAIL
jgi:hypothetical protein